MQIDMYRKLFLGISILCCSILSAQNVTGIWQGQFFTESGERYRLEFQVEQNNSQFVNGVSYSYLDKRFYGKATMTGNFVKADKLFQIQELRTTEVRNIGGSVTCLMNYKFTYSKKGKEELLEGTYLGKKEDRKNPENNGVWGDCGGGTVTLRRAENSAFYVEPFLREKPLVKRKTTPVSTAKAPVKKPLPSSKATATKPNVPAKKTSTKTTPPVVKNPRIPIKKDVVEPTTTEIKSADKEVVKNEVQKGTPVNTVRIPTQTRLRENELVKTITVHHDEITVRLYDNGEIDDDTISVYHNNRVVLSNKRLTTTPLSINLKMDSDNPDHVLVMVAENLGRIPPNTSLMVVHDGDKRYEVRITSTEQKNAMVRFRYQKTSH
jgi:hypothetical protein